ncbi:hypothetical protein L1987_56672 [Smallanthus sonchifolius]|uniref:Uncharacterized protein n=1 Tax=Smallanthus sonchifolius TaxID=185202 RepID=A0ACB9ED08_9ASTR|nr:hypothetical protein L1987_56672 [Smallanthus sonchifolius]
MCTVQALQRTIEFEEELAEKFGGGDNTKKVTSDIEELDKGNQTVMDIRKKYEKKLAAYQGNEDDFNFRGIISSCFEPHMMTYVELEERTLMEHLEKLVQDEAWGMDDGSQTNILSSSMQVFQRVLRAYATKLLMKLPKGGMGIVAAATGLYMQTSDKDERLICYIVKTAEYCHKTVSSS